MHFIVDCYNVMSQSPRLQFLDVMDLQAGGDALLELVALYLSRSHHQGHGLRGHGGANKGERGTLPLE
jgi:hypothetical protein